MEIRQLEYFVAVAEEGNFTRAAERVHITQSGVSAQIRELERDLGASLIDRSGRVATLTHAGEAALAHARDVLSAMDSVRRAVDDVVGLVRGRLVVGMVTACTVAPLFDALAAFHGEHPGVEIALVEDNSDRLIEAVGDGSMDLALVGVAGEIPPSLGSLLIISEGLAALVPADHALAAQASVTLAEVCRHRMICLPEGTGIRTALDTACAQQGLRADIALQASAPDAVADLAARGLGVAVLSRSMAAEYSNLRALPIVDVDIPALLGLVWRNDRRPALAAFLTHARRAFPVEAG